MSANGTKSGKQSRKTVTMMADLDKVLTGLSQCMMADNMEGYETQCYDCPYFNPEVTVQECIQPLKDDAIELLKSQKIAIDQFMQEQMAKEPVIFGDGATFEEAKNFWYACAVCKNPLDFCDNFCRKCGSAIDWKGVKKDGDDDGN